MLSYGKLCFCSGFYFFLFVVRFLNLKQTKRVKILDNKLSRIIIQDSYINSYHLYAQKSSLGFLFQIIILFCKNNKQAENIYLFKDAKDDISVLPNQILVYNNLFSCRIFQNHKQLFYCKKNSLIKHEFLNFVQIQYFSDSLSLY